MVDTSCVYKYVWCQAERCSDIHNTPEKYHANMCPLKTKSNMTPQKNAYDMIANYASSTLTLPRNVKLTVASSLNMLPGIPGTTNGTI